jgi:hypothetical protein
MICIISPVCDSSVPSRRKPLSIATALSSPGLASLVQRARFLRQLDRSIRASLPETLSRHVQVANLRGDCLVMLADSPTWATRLRYQRQAVLDGLWQAHSIRCRLLEVKVQPDLRS